MTETIDKSKVSMERIQGLDTALTEKQDILVSGTNIKTINNNSLIGSGNLDIDSLPSQSGQSGKYLTTNGTTATWSTINITIDQTYDNTSANAQSGVAIADAKFLRNTATGNYGLTVGGNASTATSGTNIGVSSAASGGYGTAIGYAATGGARATGLGWNAKATGADSIQIGNGTNSTSKTFCVGFYNTGNYQLLNGTTGLIPAERIPISSSVDSTSTNSTVIGAKLFYDTCGNIESLINAL